MIKDSYSEPHYTEFDWSEVDWASPLPNDLVALADLTQAVRKEYFTLVREIFAAGGTGDDAPNLTRWTWDHVVVPVGIYAGEYDSNKYDHFGRLLFAGDYVRDDRMLAQMTDAEMLEYMNMQQIAKEAMEDIDIDARLEEIKQKRDTRDREIALLETIFGEDN